VSTVEVGSTVHDFVTVGSGAGFPAPTGNVSVDWFANSQCSGNPAASSGSLGPLVVGAGHTSTFDASGFTQGPLAAGLYGFKAHYLGDATSPAFTPSDGGCEPLRVVDANIQITPATFTNEVGKTHTFTAHVNVNDGTGFVNGVGVTVNFVKQSGPGGFTSPSSCTTDSSGNCSATWVSNQTGLTVMRATTDVLVPNPGGITLHRETGDGKAGDSADAQKTWVDSYITIAPDATNVVGAPHTFTATVFQDPGTGTFVPVGAGVPVTITLTNQHGATAVPSTPLSGSTNASGQFSVTFSSATAGQVLENASTTVTIGTASISRATGDASRRTAVRQPRRTKT
jgi:hypothetical protein